LLFLFEGFCLLDSLFALQLIIKHETSIWKFELSRAKTLKINGQLY
jgi:hypothetical protein